MWVDVEQNTEEWFDLRLGKATSSNFAKIMANELKAFGNPAIEYAEKVALEIVTGERDESSSFSNGYMERGHEFEPVAINRYEIETFNNVTNGGFNFNKEKTVGDSPDGNVGEKGCVEVKSVVPKTQWKGIKKGGFDSAYKWQIHGHIWLGNKEWCDFISYCPEMPYNKQIHIERVYRDEAMISRLRFRLTQFLNEVENNVKLLQE
jgi:hypothetical protein